ncbi:MAG TPA: MarR family winged helix-turn-helix transcriptional regulator [Kofleriaceae bacterium]|nr:MarR family winged helix-turn-helix transcriptional regulator [Kofleriaceae bacterium]
MTKSRLPYFDDNTDPLPVRIAAGLNKIGLAMKQQTWELANEEGLSATQGQILALLVAHGPLSGKELSERLAVTLPTVSDSVRVLLDKKLVTKAPDPRHPRASLVTPTTRGLEIGGRARSWPEFMADAVGALSADEQQAFLSGVMKMIRSLQEQGLIPLHGMCVTCTHFRPNVRSGPSPHHCALVDAPLAGEQLRVECPDHEVAPEAERRQQWQKFLRPA